MKEIYKEHISRLTLLMIGCLIYGIGLNVFIIPSKMLSGGVSGISLILNYLFNLPTGLLIILINIPLFIISFKKLDRDFTIYSMIGTLLLSFFIDNTKFIANIPTFQLKDILLSSVFGGAITGIGGGIVFRSRGSTGGLDIISVFLKKKYGINISTISFAINIFIVLIGAFIGGLSIGLYTLISMFITAQTINFTMDGLNRRKVLFIVTEKEEEVAQGIIKELGRGVTFFYGEGAYTKEKKKVIYCIISLTQLAKLNSIIKEIDSNSFTAILDASEVQGKGFKKKTL